MSAQRIYYQECIIDASLDVVHQNTQSFLARDWGATPPWESHLESPSKWYNISHYSPDSVIIEIGDRITSQSDDWLSESNIREDRLLLKLEILSLAENRCRLLLDSSHEASKALAGELVAFVTHYWETETETWNRSSNPSSEFVERHRADVEQDVDPWERIPDHRWDRQLVEIIHTHPNTTYERIASVLKVSESRVNSRLSELRKEYGKEIIPLRRKDSKQKSE